MKVEPLYLFALKSNLNAPESGRYFIVQIIMKRIFALVSLSLATSLFAQSSATPFFVSKISPNGSYSSKSFQQLWEAFRKQYRMESTGAFVQYRYADSVFSAVESGRRMSGVVGQLIANQSAKGTNSSHMTGAQMANATSVRYRNPEEAMQAILQQGCSLVTLDIMTEDDGKSFKATLVKEDSPKMDRDLRFEDRDPKSKSTPRLVVFSYPGRVLTGQQTMLAESGRTAEARCWYQVKELPDEKLCQDNFIEAIKAGSSFRVFVLRDATCQNCGGFGTIAANGGKSDAIKSELRGTNSLDLKCKMCGGDGKVPVISLNVLIWDRYVPQIPKEDMKDALPALLSK